LGSGAFATLYGEESSRVYPVRLRQLSDAADPTTRTFEARYVLEGQAAIAPLGATVTVHLQGSGSGGALSVPFGSLDDEGKGPGVWLIDRRSSSVSFQPVTFNQFVGERVIVTGAVHPGDSIVATGGHYLHEGEKVRFALIQAAMQ
jgi:multidrug efflux pump subunit AcrA (membrane-fusion protein)